MSESDEYIRTPSVPITDTRPHVTTALDDARRKVQGKAPTRQVEIVGEAAAREWAFRAYSPEYRMSEIAIPRRGNQGDPVLDVVFRIENRSTGEVRFLFIEAKGGASKPSELAPIRNEVTWGEPIRYKQTSPLWFEFRMNELERRGQKALASTLRSAAAEGKLEAKVVTAPAFIEKVTGAKHYDLDRVAVKDVSTPILELYQQRGTRHVTDITGRTLGNSVAAPSPIRPDATGPPVTQSEASSVTRGVPSSRSGTKVRQIIPEATASAEVLRGTGKTARAVNYVASPTTYVRPVIRLRRFAFGVGLAALPAATDLVINSFIQKSISTASAQMADWLNSKFQNGGPSLEQKYNLRLMAQGYREARAKLEEDGPAWILILQVEAKHSQRWNQVHHNYTRELSRITSFANRLQRVMEECSNNIGTLIPIVENLSIYQSALFNFHLALEKFVEQLVIYSGPAAETLGPQLFGESERAKSLSQGVGRLQEQADSLLRSFRVSFSNAEKELITVLQSEEDWENPFISEGGSSDID